jgi:tRNA pseudouridine38-40 synthase
MPVVRLTLAYDGSGFHGYARQPGVRTVQGELEAALARILGTEVTTVAAGRTDTGVHARAQVVSLPAEDLPALDRLERSLNGLLGPEIVVDEAAVAPDGFDARRSALFRVYRYQVLNRPAPDPLQRFTTWHIAEYLDLDAMNLAASEMIGTHDFASFCRKAGGDSTTVRTVVEAGWSREGEMVFFTVKAHAFCHQMVRSLVGFQVDVGRGRRQPGEMKSVLEAKDRAAAGPVAPPHGLILWEVGYGG